MFICFIQTTYLHNLLPNGVGSLQILYALYRRPTANQRYRLFSGQCKDNIMLRNMISGLIVNTMTGTTRVTTNGFRTQHKIMKYSKVVDIECVRSLRVPAVWFVSQAWRENTIEDSFNPVAELALCISTYWCGSYGFVWRVCVSSRDLTCASTSGSQTVLNTL